MRITGSSWRKGRIRTIDSATGRDSMAMVSSSSEFHRESAAASTRPPALRSVPRSSSIDRQPARDSKTGAMSSAKIRRTSGRSLGVDGR